MRWQDRLIDELRRQPCCGYHRDASPATEPTSLAAIALASRGEIEAASQAAEWLAALQNEDGSVGDGTAPHGTGSGVSFGPAPTHLQTLLADKDSRPSQRPIRKGEPTPRWQTSLAILAWMAVDATRYSKQITAAVNWILSSRGEPVEPTEDLGHNTLLRAWPWLAGTHSWIEPTALHVRALKGAGYAAHTRVREAVDLLFDRQLLAGGCNYGNTQVLGQTLLPHVQPTGMAMLALAGEPDRDGRIGRALGYLERSLSARTTTASLCWGLFGLSAHKRRPADADLWFESAYGRTIRRDRAPYKIALLALAAADGKGTL